MRRLHALFDLVVTAFREWLNDNTFRLAAALAFYTIFSLAPILVISIGVAGAFFGQERARERVVGELEQLVGEQGGAAIREVAARSDVTEGSAWAITVGVVTLLIGSTVVFAELQSALNHIWDVEADPSHGAIRGLIRARARSFLIATGVAFLLLVSLVISAMLAAMQAGLSRWMPGGGWLWELGHFASSLLIVTLLFAMTYKLLPDVQIQWRDVWIGALVTSLLFNGGKSLIGLYLGQMAVGSAYGAAGSFVVLLIWIYYSALICFYGAEFTQVFARRYGSHIHPATYAQRVGEKPDEI